MRIHARWIGVVVVLAGLFACASNAFEEAPAKSLDEKIHESLRTVINEGAALYNQGDATGSYRVFQGALLAVTPMLEHHPELVEKINQGLEKAKTAPSCRHRAYELRKVLDTIRSELATSKLPKPSEKKEIEKGSSNKDVEKKSDTEDKTIEKKVDDKTIEKKADEKTIEKKSEGKTIEKKKID